MPQIEKPYSYFLSNRFFIISLDIFYTEQGRRSVEEVIHKLLKDNHGAMSAYEIFKKLQHSMLGRSTTELQILKHVKESGVFETLLLPPWLKQKLINDSVSELNIALKH